MTKPEVFRDSQWAIERGQRSGSKSVDMFEAAQNAIEETRRLLIEVARETMPAKDKCK